MVRRINVGGVVRSKTKEDLMRPPLAVLDVLGADPEKRFGLGQATLVIGERDLGLKELWRVGRPRLDRRAEVDDVETSLGEDLLILARFSRRHAVPLSSPRGPHYTGACGSCS